MATVTEAPEITRADAPFPITAAIYEGTVERGEIPEDRRVYLWGGRLFEKMAKSKPHAYVQTAILNALADRKPAGVYLAAENPVRLDPLHLPLPDLVVCRGALKDLGVGRYPDGRDVLLVVEVAVTSLADDLGPRLSRYASTLPQADSLVADVPGRRLLWHRGPIPAVGDAPGRYRTVETLTVGGVLRLLLGDVELAPIPIEELFP